MHAAHGPSAQLISSKFSAAGHLVGMALGSQLLQGLHELSQLVFSHEHLLEEGYGGGGL